MLKNLTKYPWIVDQFFILSNEKESGKDDELWKFIQDRELIEKVKENGASKANLDASQIIDMMKNDFGSSAIVGGLQQQKKLIEQVKKIKRLALKERKSWDNPKIKEWSENRKKASKSEQLDPVEFLSIAFLAVKWKRKHDLRDAQLLAVLIFVSSTYQQGGSQIGRRMAQISTGEGKTLITALLVVYHVLDNWSNGRRFVDIITSTTVLAEENVKEMQWFFELFGIAVANNCDAACSEDESLRCKRYNSDVIYGDMSSFQRDILLSNFFSERKITGGRKTGAVVVDEVITFLYP
jgi:preprotein translocase subunit SecA